MPKQYKRPSNLSDRINLAILAGLSRRKSIRLFAEKWAKLNPQFGMNKWDAARIAEVANDPMSLVGKYADTAIPEMLAYNPDGFAALFVAVRNEVKRRGKTNREKVADVVDREFFMESTRRPLDSKLIAEELEKQGLGVSEREIQRILAGRESALMRLEKQRLGKGRR